jgi:hypothetical protein
MRKRIEHSINGKVVDKELYDKLCAYAQEVVNKVCNEIAPEYDIIDIEGLFISALGFPFALQLSKYAATCEKKKG